VKLGLFVRPHGHHLAAWRKADTPADRVLDFSYYRNIARRAESTKLDFVFFADSMGVRASHQPDDAFERTGHVAHFEPTSLLAALAVVTDRIGLVATASTTYHEPYHLARLFASLDHLSGGRAGWNIVTSNGVGEAENFGSGEHPAHAARYDRARESVRVVERLWDSSEDDAFVWDKDSGIALDLRKLHLASHKGRHFSVRGPLNVERPPQGHPVLVQAGGSDEGCDFAAATAEVIFSVQTELDLAQAFYADMKARAASYGRNPNHLLIMPGLCPVIGATRSEAQAKYAELQELLHPALGLSMVSNLLGGIDLSGYPLDGPVPEAQHTIASKLRRDMLLGLAHREKMTLGDLARHIAGTRGHHQVVGTAVDVADRIEQWVVEGGADGFNILPAAMPGNFEDFARLVVPELQRRGLFRTDYEGSTLRQHLGLPRPAHPASRNREALAAAE
jgi:alkanesulfonate monooxygenase